MPVRATPAVSSSWHHAKGDEAGQATEILLPVAWFGRACTENRQYDAQFVPRRPSVSGDALAVGALPVVRFMPRWTWCSQATVKRVRSLAVWSYCKGRSPQAGDQK